MQEYKIDVRALTEQQKKDVQDAFFSMGYKWRGSETNYQQLHSNFYFAETNGYIMYCEEKDFFFTSKDTSTHKQITYTELMTLVYGDNTMNKFTKAAFTKASLKDGMVVKLRGGCEYSQTCDGLCLVLGSYYANKTGHVIAQDFKDDLTSTLDTNFDIVEVFTVKTADTLDLNRMNLKSIWKRSEQTQQQTQLAELKAAQEELLLKAKEINDKISALQQGN